jgi:flavin reductase (DIM6/NTAB) family NADH-FMN oxidoreductase RutF
MRTLVDTGVYGEYLHYGMPLTLVTVQGNNGQVNVSTNASITPLPGDRLRLVIGIFTENLTNQLIAESKEFVVNVISDDMRGVAKLCGDHSGKKIDKLALCDLTLTPSAKIKTPLILECPLNIECRVESVHHLDDLDLWIAEILAIQVAPNWSDGRRGVDLQRYKPLLYTFGRTLARGPVIGAGSL